MTRPRVSVVTPTHDRAHLLPQAVDSVLGQTAGDLELIVIDDGSTDGTLDVLGQYDDPRLKVIAIPHSGIPGHVRNVGLQEAQGEFVAFLDSDDIWLPEKIERQLAVLGERPEV